MPDVQLAAQSIATTSATTAPGPGTHETWTVAALPAGVRALQPGERYALIDITPGCSLAQQAEIIRVVACVGPGATSVDVVRGDDQTTPVAHAASAQFAVIQVPSGMAYPDHELAYAENTTGTATPVSGFGVYSQVPGVAVVVPPTPRPVWLEWNGDYVLSGAQAGVVYLSVLEIPAGGGSGTQIATSQKSVTAAQNGAYSATVGDVPGKFRLGPTTVTRTFALSGVLLYDVTDFTANLQNTAVNPTWLRAFVA